jgi:hypothetical protein
MRIRYFKMLLTDAEHEQLHDLAHDQRVSAADLVRSLVLGPEACQRLPSHATLRDILRQLSGIATNLNQVTYLANSANTRGELTHEQFAAIYKAIAAGHKAWSDPKKLLGEQLGLVQPKLLGEQLGLVQPKPKPENDLDG